MWFVKITVTPPGHAKPFNLITEMTCLSLSNGEQQYVYPTQFFVYFKDCPCENVFSHLPRLGLEDNKALGVELLNDLLEEKEREERVTTA